MSIKNITADVGVGMNSIEGWEFKTKLVLDETGNNFPLVLYMERPGGQNANKLMLLACKKVPQPVRDALHPGAFKPRKTSDGWVTDPGRKRQMQVGVQCPDAGALLNPLSDRLDHRGLS